MSFKEMPKEKTTLVCSTCGKPVGSGAKSNVTRFLFQESRCTCSTWGVGKNASSTNDDHSTKVANRSAHHSTSQEAEPAELDAAVAENLGDRYEIVSLLGRGGMGAVYKVKDTALEKTFAIKVLNSNLVEDKNSIKRCGGVSPVDMAK